MDIAEDRFANAHRFLLVARRGIGCEPYNHEEEFLRYDFFGEPWEAAKFMADAVIRELHDGDGENGGRGSLQNCWGDIFNSFRYSGHYEYADCRFKMSAN